MITRLFRTLLLLCVLLGIVLPKSSVALAQLGLIRGQVLVICTGEGLMTLILGEDGTPVEVKHADHPCLLVHATDTAAPVRLPQVLALAAPLALAPHMAATPPRTRHTHDARPRAPPLV